MKISFPCTGCGRRLKARPDSVGRTRKCPVCATRVTCPGKAPAAARVEDEVLDAEIVDDDEEVPAPRPERRSAGTSPPSPVAPPRRAAPPPPAPAPAAAPFADLDDDPYPLAGPAPGAGEAAEPKKPCPICGETILASAVKCRFCGEVFDAKLRKSGSKKKRRKSSGSGSGSAGARDVLIGIVCMGLGIGLTVATFAAASSNNNGSGRFVVFYGLVLGGFVQMCRGFYGMIRGD